MSSNKTVFRYFIVIFLLVGSLLTGIIRFSYDLETKTYFATLKSRELTAVNIQLEIIENNFLAIVSDLKFLAGQNHILHALIKDEKLRRELLAKEYYEFCRQKAVYDQLRFLDDKSMELIRVNYNDGVPEIVPKAELQDKSGRYYCEKTLALGCNEIFASPFDLNIENGKIEVPFKPMIRFCMPLCRGMNDKYGMIVLNYLGDKVLNLIRENNSNLMLVNHNGYWLYSPKSDDTWGFMIDERKQRRFPSDFPTAWEKIVSAQEGQFYSEKGLFSFSTVHPLRKVKHSELLHSRLKRGEIENIEQCDRFWKIISFIPQKRIAGKINKILLKFIALAFLTCLLAFVSAWLLARLFVKRKLRQMELYELANFDKLTHLPNRASFQQTLNKTHYQALRYGQSYAILFIDLNGFKKINDTLGHDAGDLVLIEVGRRLESCIRKSDTVARLGGDEFTIILPFMASAEKTQKVAHKIGQEIATPMLLHGQKRQVTASIGIAFYPDDGDDTETLLKKADDEMYKMKRAMKKPEFSAS